jgi:transposase
MRVIKNAKHLGSVGIDPVIPPRSNRNHLRPCDWFVYKERYLIECFFNKIKPYRRVFSRYEKWPKIIWDFYDLSPH